MILLLLMPDLGTSASQTVQIEAVQAGAHFHTARALPDQPGYTRGPYVLYMAPISNCPF